jgi:hypothetical protein
MDLVEGPNLAQLIRGQPWEPERAAQCVRDVATAIHHAHQQGILHRDIKPSNVLIDKDGHPRVTDFGLAKHITTSELATQSVCLTVPGEVLGSPNFMPPEQAEGRVKEIACASDVYSLGALLYYLLTGRPPFVENTIAATLRLISEAEPIAPSSLVSQVPRDLETICLRCLKKDPLQRYQTAEELRDELDRFVCGKPILARPPGAAERAWRFCNRHQGVIAATTAVLVFATLAFFGWANARRNERIGNEEREKSRRILNASDAFLVDRALHETNETHAADVLRGLDSALTRHPEDASLWHARGVVLERQGALAAAQESFSKAISLVAKDASAGPVLTAALRNRRNLLKRMNRLRDARADDYAVKKLPVPAELLSSPQVDYASAEVVTLTLGFTNRERGLYATKYGDSRFSPETHLGSEAWHFAPGLNYGYFFADPTFKWTLESDVLVQVERCGAAPELHFDEWEDRYAVAPRDGSKVLEGEWRLDEFRLNDISFDNSQNGGADFRLFVPTGDFYVRKISVIRLKSPPEALKPLNVPSEDSRQSLASPTPTYVVNATDTALFGAAVAVTNSGRLMFHFSGRNSLAVISNFGPRLPQTEISISLWQKLEAVNERTASVQLAPYSWPGSFRLIAPHHDGRIYFDFGNNRFDGQVSYRPRQPIVGAWQNFVCVASQEGNLMQIYRNGVLEAQKASMSPLSRGRGDLLIGDEFSGWISDVWFFDRPLTPAEIRSSYESQRGAYSGK